MSDENALVTFLYDYPWSSRPVLESIFGLHFERLAKTRETRTIQIPGLGTCWGVKQEKLSSIPGVRRRELAKLHLINDFGKDALWTGSSPGPWGSDLLARAGDKKNHWKILSRRYGVMNDWKMFKKTQAPVTNLESYMTMTMIYIIGKRHSDSCEVPR